MVAAALIGEDGKRVLIQRRAVGSQHAGLWEFPGGKVEPGEAPEAALVRELHEELGIAVLPGALVPVAFASDAAIPAFAGDAAWPALAGDAAGPAFAGDAAMPMPAASSADRSHVILLYLCRAWTGEPSGLEGIAIDWVDPAALAGRAMPPLDVPLVQALRRFLASPAADGI